MIEFGLTQRVYVLDVGEYGWIESIESYKDGVVWYGVRVGDRYVQATAEGLRDERDKQN